MSQIRKGVEAMQITDVRVRKITKEGRMKAVVSITLDNEFAIHDIKIIEGEKGLFIAMPSKKSTEGASSQALPKFTCFSKSPLFYQTIPHSTSRVGKMMPRQIFRVEFEDLGGQTGRRVQVINPTLFHLIFRQNPNISAFPISVLSFLHPV